MDELQKLAANTAALVDITTKLTADLAELQNLRKENAALKDQITALQNAAPAAEVVAANTAISDSIAKLTAAGA